MEVQDHTTSIACQIRPATRRDLEIIGDLWVELMDFHAGIDSRFRIPVNSRTGYIRILHNALHDEHYRVLVAEWGGTIVGYIMGNIAENPPINPRFGFIDDLCVTTVHRRAGIGARLVRALCQWFRERGLTSVQLNVAHLNPVSQAFWRKQGCADFLDRMWMNLDR